MFALIKGFIIAVSMLVPGVSGASMMMALNVYEPSLEFLSHLAKGKLVHKKLMLHLFIGAIIGLLLFSRSMIWLLNHYGDSIRFFFLGSILFGLIPMFKDILKVSFKKHHLILIFVGILISLGLNQFEGLVVIESNPNIVVMILAGIGIAVALILPGISTSFVLLALGAYEPILRALSTFDFSVILWMLIGIGLGILMTTNFLVYCLTHHAILTNLLIIGFVLGSLIEIIPMGSQLSLPLSILYILLGGLFIGVLSFVARTVEN